MQSSNRTSRLAARWATSFLLSTGVWLGAWLVWSADTASPASPAKPAEVTIPKSEFKPIGRDPFFPERALGETTGTVQPTDTEPAKPRRLALKLLGITGSTDRPIALINRTTFAIGETAEVKDETGNKAKVTLVGIQGTAVTVQVESEGEARRLDLEK
jgi:hypothetical protein